MPDAQIHPIGEEAAPADYVLPPGVELRLKAVYASFDGSGAGGDFVPLVRIISDAGSTVIEAPADTTVAAGASADVSWFPRVRLPQAAPPAPGLARNVGEIGLEIFTDLDLFGGIIVAHEDVARGDGILISAQAPSLPSLAAPRGVPVACSDSVGNTYIALDTHLWEASPPNVNEGAVQQFFYCASSVADMAAGSQVIDVAWDNPVYDRSVYGWLIRYKHGAHQPDLLAATPDNDAATFASNQVTLGTSGFTPASDQGLEFATILAIKAGGVGGFGGVAGFNGFFQAQFRIVTGKQQYMFNVQTAFADVFLVTATVPQYELDLGTLPASVLVPGFNGVGQRYGTGTNAWKGITIRGVS